ncbi:hypothetical protein M0805_006524 [Coniferiporia weirii]|nr:hypothetical protein M0805_006524 [Coniferiporia weirii]
MSYYKGPPPQPPMSNYQDPPSQSQMPHDQGPQHRYQGPYHPIPPSQSQSSMYCQDGASQATPPPYTSQLNLSDTAVAPEELAEYLNQDAEALFSSFREPPPYLQPLALPLCLPQATSGTNALFVRAYSQELRSSGIEVDDWMRFIDGLNLAITASPPLRVVDVAGMVIGFVPHHWATMAGAAMRTQTGIHKFAKTLSDKLLLRANAEYFAPRGMRVRICKTAAMRQIVGLDAVRVGDPSKSEKLVKFGKAAGRTAETVALHLPIIRNVYNLVAPPVPSVDPNAPDEMAARRMLALQGYALPLSFDVPPATPVQGIMDNASGLSGRMQTWRLRQNIAGRSSGKLRKNVEIADRLEYKSTDNLLWVVLVNADQDAEIQGTELVDNAEDVETIRDADWQQEMRREAKKDQYTMNQELKSGKSA